MCCVPFPISFVRTYVRFCVLCVVSCVRCVVCGGWRLECCVCSPHRDISSSDNTQHTTRFKRSNRQTQTAILLLSIFDIGMEWNPLPHPTVETNCKELYQPSCAICRSVSLQVAKVGPPSARGQRILASLQSQNGHRFHSRS